TGATGAQGVTGPAGASMNPMKIALLRWWNANQTGITFAVGTNPRGIACDGTNLWVANQGSNSVTKLLAATGALVGTYTVGTVPLGVAYDGANVWVTNYSSNNVTK